MDIFYINSLLYSILILYVKNTYLQLWVWQWCKQVPFLNFNVFGRESMQHRWKFYLEGKVSNKKLYKKVITGLFPIKNYIKKYPIKVVLNKKLYKKISSKNLYKNVSNKSCIE